MDPRFPNTCPPSMFRGELGQEMDVDMCPPGAYYSAQHSQHIPHDQQTCADQNTYGSSFHAPNHQSTMTFEYYMQRSQRFSASTQSSHSSALRSSNGSNFSFWDPRNSVASTNTTWSQSSIPSTDQQLASPDRAFNNSFSITTPLSPSPVAEPFKSPAKKRVTPRQPAQDKDKEPFLTCASRPKRTRRSQKEPRYWCTACLEGFGEKYDWKRHEETYQERPHMFECGLCNNIYFLEKDFIHHHQRSHRCQVCVEKKHVAAAQKKRMTRTGWGCGFCSHFSYDWKERCDHVGWHFEKNGDNMAKWKHAQVIYSLLHRPEILPHWLRLLEDRKRTQTTIGWNQHSTGRNEGYPEMNPKPQLQDLLEFYTPDQDASEIARQALAAMRKPAQEKTHLEKELPPLPPSGQDHYLQPGTHQTADPQSNSLQQPILDLESWNALEAIPEDTVPPTDVCLLPHDELNAAFNYGPLNYPS